MAACKNKNETTLTTTPRCAALYQLHGKVIVPEAEIDRVHRTK